MFDKNNLFNKNKIPEKTDNKTNNLIKFKKKDSGVNELNLDRNNQVIPDEVKTPKYENKEGLFKKIKPTRIIFNKK